MQLCVCHGARMRWNKDARMRAGGYWRCAVKGHDYEVSAAGRDRKSRHEAKRIRVHIGDRFYSYRIPSDRKDDLKARLAEFRAARVHDQEVPVGRLDSPVA